MDAGNGRATVAQVGGRDYYPLAFFLCGGDWSSRFECASRSDEFDSARRLFFRTKSFRAQQPRRGSLLSSLLEYERTLFVRFSTLLRGRGFNYFVCLPPL